MVFSHYPNCFSLRDHLCFWHLRNQNLRARTLGSTCSLSSQWLLGSLILENYFLWFPFPTLWLIFWRGKKERKEKGRAGGSKISIIALVQFGLYLPCPTGALSPHCALPISNLLSVWGEPSPMCSIGGTQWPTSCGQLRHRRLLWSHTPHPW